jgi:hypothetical protein
MTDVLSSIMLWPLNLLRDTPRRFGRLLGILASGPPAGRGRLLTWLQALAWSLFDLVGGPEIVQIGWRLATETRPLTDEEIEAASAVLGPEAIRYEDVRIANGGPLRSIFDKNHNRAFATWHTINMPPEKEKKRALLVHELTHTRQYERIGSVYIGQGLGAQRRLGQKAYDYGGPEGLQAHMAAGKRYSDYNREQQGQIAQDYCALVESGGDTAAYEPLIRELRQGLV